MGEVGLRRAGALLDHLAQPAAAVALGEAQRQLCQMLRHRKAQVRRHAERGRVRAQQRKHIDEI